MRRLPLILSVLFLTGILLAAPTPGSLSVRGPGDPPVLTLPPDSTVMTTHPLGSVVTYSATASDWKGRRVPVSCTPASGSLFPPGETRVGCSASDRRGRTGTGSFVVTVVAEPALSAPGTPSPAAGEGEPTSGAGVTAPVRMAWQPDPAATYYNLQLFRVSGGSAAQPEKLLSVWPAEARFILERRWTYDGRSQRLTAGSYRWYVWPGYGLRSERRFGPLLQQGSFVVVARAQ